MGCMGYSAKRALSVILVGNDAFRVISVGLLGIRWAGAGVLVVEVRVKLYAGEGGLGGRRF